MSRIDTILLVDDDQITNFINTRLIKKLNVTDEIMVALNGEEALKFIRSCSIEGKKCPDVIFLDINMPVTDGFGFLKEFENIDIDEKDQVKIIILTTSTNPKDLKNLEQFNIKGFINKPLTEQKVKEALEEI
ncbi:MAG: response regulator [Cytophagaceae bacterium]